MAYLDLNFWLTLASDFALALAGLSFAALMTTQLKRLHKVKIGWFGKAILLLLIINELLRVLPEAEIHGRHKAARGFAMSLILLFIGGFAWPFCRQVKKQFLKPERASTDDALAVEDDSKHRLRQAQKIAQVGHWHYHVAEDRLIWSAEIYHIYGVSKVDAKQRLMPNMAFMVKFYHPDDQEIVIRGFQNAIMEKRDFEISARLFRQSGELRHVMLRGVAETGDHGRTTSIFGVLMDITSQKTIELELKDANAASALANRSLHEMAMHDSLTGLPNRRHFDSTLATEFKRAAREKTPLGLIMIDLDQFKSYNDKYGHPAGDDCLRKVAEAIAGVLQRPADLAARYGGEEMAVLLPNTNLTGTEVVAKFILQAVRDLKLLHESNAGGIVTISCGIATFTPETDPQVPVMLIERADKALYQAKMDGRNRVKNYSAHTSADRIN